MSFICNEIYSKPFLEKVRKLSERYLAHKIARYLPENLKQHLRFMLQSKQSFSLFFIGQIYSGHLFSTYHFLLKVSFLNVY